MENIIETRTSFFLVRLEQGVVIGLQNSRVCRISCTSLPQPSGDFLAQTVTGQQHRDLVLDLVSIIPCRNWLIKEVVELLLNVTCYLAFVEPAESKFEIGQLHLEHAVSITAPAKRS